MLPERPSSRDGTIARVCGRFHPGRLFWNLARSPLPHAQVIGCRSTYHGTALAGEKGGATTMNGPIPARWEPFLLSVLRIVTAFLYIAHGTQKLVGYPAAELRP